MAKILQVCGGSSGGLSGGATHYFIAGTSHVLPSATEARRQITYKHGGVLSNLAVRISANDRGASTARTRINGSNGTQSASIGASTTGYFEDTTNSDTITADDEVCTAIEVGAGGSTFTARIVATNFAATTDTITHLVASGAQTFGSPSATRRCNIAGEMTLVVTESNMVNEISKGGTLRNFCFYLSANARTTDTVFRIRNAGTNGNQTITVTAGTTGLFEDNSNTDTVAANSDVDYQFVTSTGSENMTLQFFSSEFVTTDNVFVLANGGTDGSVANTTEYTNVSGEILWVATETTPLYTARVAFFWSDLWCNVTVNNSDGAGTLTARKNSADAGPSVAITASTTGQFEDSSNTASVAAGDTLTYKMVVAGTTGTITTRGISSMGTASQTVGANHLSVPVTLYQPTVTVGSVVVGADHLSAPVTIYEPSVALSGGAQAVEANHLSAPVTLYNPTVTTGAVTVSPNHLSAGATVHEPTVTVGAVSVTLNHLSATVTVYDPTVTVGSVTVSVNHLSVTVTIYQPAVTVGAITIQLTHLVVTETIYEPTVTTGSVVITANHLSAVVTVYSPTVTTFIAVTSNALVVAAVVHSPSVSTGLATVVVGALSAPATVHAPTVLMTGLVTYLRYRLSTRQPPSRITTRGQKERQTTTVLGS